jgi:hypothetical protein
VEAAGVEPAIYPYFNINSVSYKTPHHFHTIFIPSHVQIYLKESKNGVNQNEHNEFSA